MTELTNDQREALGRLADLILDACAEAWGMIAPHGRMKSKQAIITALEYFVEPAWCELKEVPRLREENKRLRSALSPFAKIGNPEKSFKWIDVPFEWCEAAFRALEHGKEAPDDGK